MASAKIEVPLKGSVSFTLQTLGLSIAYYFLQKEFRLGLILFYLLLGILGVPVFSQGEGWAYFISWPIGFFVGFFLAAFIKANKESSIKTFYYFLIIHTIILAAGFIGFIIHSMTIQKALNEIYVLVPGAILKSISAFIIIWFYNKIWLKFTRSVGRK